MDLPTNRNPPTIMHIDMNASFARAEQQARPLLRGKPVGIAAYTGPSGCVVSPSVEAKQRGIKTAASVREARMLAPDITILPPDPNLYREIHRRFCKIYRDYSPDVVPKSIDEAVIDFTGTPILRVKTMEEVGQEIKQRIRTEIGSWMSCNVGIGTNRFLAKLAASLHKPDGLDTITHENLHDIYDQVTLMDLCGINTRYQARLNASGIFSPIEFFAAGQEFLTKQVFKSVTGHYWYLRLRGWEIDAIDFGRKSFGNSYALQKQTARLEDLAPFLMKLCEKTGRRLRQGNFIAYGIHVALIYSDGTHWHTGTKVSASLYTTQEIYTKALMLLQRQTAWKAVRNLAVSVFELAPAAHEQVSLFADGHEKRRRLSDAMDQINDRYGEFLITPALMLGMENTILDRISFGNVRELFNDVNESSL
jgi:DNA polymerase-4